jgi:hypothetical protein
MGGAGNQSGVGGAGQAGASSGAGAGGDGGAGAPQGGSTGGGTAGAAAGGASGGGQGGSVGGAGSAGAGSGAAGMGGSGPSRPARVLLYFYGALPIIPTIQAQLDLLTQRLDGLDYEVDESEDPTDFTDDNLSRYAAVGMINTCFSPFGENQSGVPQSEALQRFLQAGGGLFGTHCADVTFQSANPPALYNQLLGGRASSSNFDGVSNCRTTAEHATTAELPATFEYSGNLDGTDFIKEDSVVLVKCRWDRGNGTDVAVSWVRTEGAGRVFFTNFGKVAADLTHPTLGSAHIVRGLSWVLGL